MQTWPVRLDRWIGFFGSVATLLAAVVSYLLRNVRIKDIPFLVPMAPVLFNALVVGVELACFSDVGFGFQNFSWVAFGYNALTVGAGSWSFAMHWDYHLRFSY